MGERGHPGRRRGGVRAVGVCGGRGRRKPAWRDVLVLIWVVLSFFWDTNLMTALALQRGVPLVAAAVAAVGAWLSLGKPERVCAKAVGTR